MNYCSHCGGSVASQIPAGDNRPRFVCMECQTIHYQNPRIVAGCLPVWQEQVLLCRRAIEPRRGYWTLPAGFMENGETMQQAAARETLEEACAVVHRLQPIRCSTCRISIRSTCSFVPSWPSHASPPATKAST